MPTMTMPFMVHDQKEIADLKLGDAIAFRMTLTKKDLWIDHVRKISRADVDVRDPKPVSIPDNQSPAEEVPVARVFPHG